MERQNADSERQPAGRVPPAQRTAGRDTSNLSRSYHQNSYRSSSHYPNRSNPRENLTAGPERSQKRPERTEPYRINNPPSTERTITARNQPRETIRGESRRREESYNTYQSREYRRYDHTGHQRAAQRSQPPRSLWVEKPSHRERTPPHMEKSESSRPLLQPLQGEEPPTTCVATTEEAVIQAKEDIRGYLIQYTSCQDPTESATRRERLRQAEEEGEIEEAANRLARNNLTAINLLTSEPMDEASPVRTPISQRLGPINENQSAFERLGPRVSPPEENNLPQSLQQIQRRKATRTPLRHTTPLSLWLWLM
ncbi:zf-CCHC_4 domain-containing protein [Raphanus sativus]|nr:zf-CCHC_4 domain-containing protein [Raphanus sativus]